MGWTPLFLQHQPFFGEKRIDQKTPEKSEIFQVRKSMILDDVVSLKKRLNKLNFNYELEI